MSDISIKRKRNKNSDGYIPNDLIKELSLFRLGSGVKELPDDVFSYNVNLEVLRFEKLWSFEV